MLHDARAVLAELGVPRRAGALRAVLRRRAAARAAPRRGRGHRRDHRGDRRARRPHHHRAAARATQTDPRRRPGDARPTCRSPARAACAAPAGPRSPSGEVDMRRNYALEPAEVEAGFVLTCQSHPLATPSPWTTTHDRPARPLDTARPDVGRRRGQPRARHGAARPRPRPRSGRDDRARRHGQRARRATAAWSRPSRTAPSRWPATPAARPPSRPASTSASSSPPTTATSWSPPPRSAPCAAAPAIYDVTVRRTTPSSPSSAGRQPRR